MSANNLALRGLENIKGVITDLDDGGLDTDEAIEQIRDLLGMEKPIELPKRVLFTYLVPVTLRVNLEEGSVEAAEIESGNAWRPMPNQILQDADTHRDLDPTDEATTAAEEKVKAIADDGGWQYDLTIV